MQWNPSEQELEYKDDEHDDLNWYSFSKGKRNSQSLGKWRSSVHPNNNCVSDPLEKQSFDWQDPQWWWWFSCEGSVSSSSVSLLLPLPDKWMLNKRRNPLLLTSILDLEPAFLSLLHSFFESSNLNGSLAFVSVVSLFVKKETRNS